MSILIKGMEMPKEPTLITIYPDGRWVDYTETDCCGISVEIPPHGDLIDADALINSLCCDVFEEEWGGKISRCGFSREKIREQPTIIEAEEVKE